ncbi:hypothetical protein L2E82_33485 [Cichorium intybus]|uniref:Uncharacterized protein n=1 Tax=Cichorium intybus TaxID=13427 RepID=A0ACB9BK92_CICIN|nr:hypothetical protein L2E82_33485 [Cichorium intybus]
MGVLRLIGKTFVLVDAKLLLNEWLQVDEREIILEQESERLEEHPTSSIEHRRVEEKVPDQPTTMQVDPQKSSPDREPEHVASNNASHGS